MNAAPQARVDAERNRRMLLDAAAWQCKSDNITGSIEVGKYADLVMLEENPTKVDPTTISKIAVSQTRLARVIRFSK